MKKRWVRVALILGLATICAAMYWVRPRLWLPVSSSSILIDSAPWKGSEILVSPDHQDYLLLGPNDRSHRYLINLNRMDVALVGDAYFRFWGIVLSKEPEIIGMKMDPLEEYAPYDPELKVSPDRKSFSFRNEDHRIIEVTGL